jgi:hypothetical protein
MISRAYDISLSSMICDLDLYYEIYVLCMNSNWDRCFKSAAL